MTIGSKIVRAFRHDDGEIYYELACHHVVAAVDVGLQDFWPDSEAYVVRGCPYCTAPPTDAELADGNRLALAEEAVQTSAPRQWRSCILEGRPEDLDALLEAAEREHYEVRFVLPNGVNRWTIITRRWDE